MESVKISDSVFSENGNLYTLSLEPGKRVYGERLVSRDGKEYREWIPNRSKLSAYVKCGGKQFPFKKNSKVLYLGAASGTTASHVSDLVPEGKVFCVEFSERSFRDLVKNCEGRKNMIPILGDATKPDEYSFLVDMVDIVYEDVAQKNQVDILVKNMKMFSAEYGFVSIKARSEDVTSDPLEIFKNSEKRITELGLRILTKVNLEKYEADHMMFVVETNPGD